MQQDLFDCVGECFGCFYHGDIIVITVIRLPHSSRQDPGDCAGRPCDYRRKELTQVFSLLTRSRKLEVTWLFLAMLPPALGERAGFSQEAGFRGTLEGCHEMEPVTLLTGSCCNILSKSLLKR